VSYCIVSNGRSSSAHALRALRSERPVEDDRRRGTREFVTSHESL
jgi:hypothetical protein